MSEKPELAKDINSQTLQLLRRAGDLPLTAGGHPRPQTFGGTDVGLIRERNEDQFLVAQLERALVIDQCGLSGNDGRRITDDPPGLLMMVADGMGGQVHGEVASAVVVDAMMQYAVAMLPWLSSSGAIADLEEEQDQQRVSAALARGFSRAVQRARDRMESVATRKGFDAMGSTLTMAYVSWPLLHLVHVGDSRAYLHRGDEFVQLTRDHNIAGEMIRQQVLTEEQARGSRFASMLTNSVSTSHKEMRVDLYQHELQRGDRLLLCTDGLHGELSTEQIAGPLRLVTVPEAVKPCVESLIRQAKRAGGNDNITALLALF